MALNHSILSKQARTHQSKTLAQPTPNSSMPALKVNMHDLMGYDIDNKLVSSFESSL